MKKSVKTSDYSNYNKEIKLNFVTFTTHFFSVKNVIGSLCSEIAFLFQEKLPIIYANIRVWMVDYFVLLKYHNPLKNSNYTNEH